ncbi:MAG TPA: SgcJ/EcaC family oxidoreductase [Gemmatimonadales bacterium]|nr:SgcJ/EcaC family oxidoreductase [Gemmatimonadales bacterium]
MTAYARRAAAALAPALLLLAGCSGRFGQPADDAERAMAETLAAYEEASNSGDPGALSALYTDDALLLPPDGGVVSGREAIREFWTGGMETGLSFEVVRTSAGPEGGFIAGRFHLAATDASPADSGKYVLCLRRGGDGRWRVTADIWNSTPSEDEQQEGGDHDPRTSVAAVMHQAMAVRTPVTIRATAHAKSTLNQSDVRRRSPSFLNTRNARKPVTMR